MRLALALVLSCGGSAAKPPPSPPPKPDMLDELDEDGPSDPVAVALLGSDRHRGCTLEYVSSGQAFHGVVPATGIDSAGCCVLPSAAILCLTTEDLRGEANVEQGTATFRIVVEHARLFDAGAQTPWRDAIVSIYEPGPMDNPLGKARPIVSARIESDAKTFRIVALEEAACMPGKALPCTDDPAACRAYRALLAPHVDRFCKDRGITSWRGARLAR